MHLQSSEIRVYILNMYSIHARRVMCAVSYILQFPIFHLFSSPKQSFLSKADFSPLLHSYMYEHIQAASRAREEFDPAFHYRSYVWITLGWYRHLWWTVDVAQDDQVNCTDAELDTLLERSIAVQYFPTAENRTAPTDVSLVSVMSRCGDVILCEGVNT